MDSGFVISTRKGKGGILTLEDNKAMLNEVIDWDAAAGGLQSDSEQRRWFAQFLKDTTGLNERVNAAIAEEWEADERDIVQFLTPDKKHKDDVVMNVFLKDRQNTVRLRCALLQCPFGDMNRVVSAVVKNVRKAERSIATLHYSKSEPVSTVIDELAKTTGIVLLIVKHANASADPQLVSLFSLLSTYHPIRDRVNSLRVLFCTPQDVLQDDIGHLLSEMASVRRFTYLRPQLLFQLLIDSLQDANDALPILLDGQFLSFLRQTFFSVDYSVNRLISFINFAILDKYLKYPLWRIQSGGYSARLDAYNNVLQSFFILFHNRSEYKGTFKFESVTELDEHIQTVEGFWQEVRESDYYSTWRNRLKTTTHLNDSLPALLLCLSKAVKSEEGERLKDEFEAAVAEESEEARRKELSNKTNAPSNQKMTSLQLQQKYKAKIDMQIGANQSPKISQIKEKCLQFIENAFKENLHRHPTEMTVGSGVAEQLRCNLPLQTETKLATAKPGKENYLAAAWIALLEQPEWKIVKLNEWFADFKEKMPSTDKQIADEFYSGLFLFEQMGLVRPGSDARKESTALCIFHPLLRSFL
ncbi:hypothetical protein WR25_22451 [Diploscapter pachys]|uniref:Origin recognition complex subunit 3 n=1 Tax=Diploscapter pachys TaxID=2018661 RepID=A0A2A2KDS2_9BILA|nr:hypothetical protein WR25_22451 [Diploscapter pachys]